MPPAHCITECHAVVRHLSIIEFDAIAVLCISMYPVASGGRCRGIDPICDADYREGVFDVDLAEVL